MYVAKVKQGPPQPPPPAAVLLFLFCVQEPTCPYIECNLRCIKCIIQVRYYCVFPLLEP